MFKLTRILIRTNKRQGKCGKISHFLLVIKLKELNNVSYYVQQVTGQ